MKRSSPTERGAPSAGGSGTARLMLYALIAISLMALDYRGHYVERVRSLGERLVEPVFWLVDLPARSVEFTADALRDRAEIESRLEHVEIELEKARARLGVLADLHLENSRLRALLETARRTRQDFIAAELAGVDLDPFAHRILVRRGREHGVRPGMPVIDDRAVLGQVDEAFGRTATVILISDPDHALPVQILPGGERTIAYGSGALDRLRLTDLPMNAAVAPGDRVVTSGIGGRFPAGLEVARIVSVTREPGQAFASAVAEPLAGMDRNRVVLILKPGPEPEVGTEAEPAAAPESGPDDESGEAPAAEEDR